MKLHTEREGRVEDEQRNNKYLPSKTPMLVFLTVLYRVEKGVESLVSYVDGIRSCAVLTGCHTMQSVLLAVLCCKVQFGTIHT